jgi:hypothetical protein
MQQSLVPVEPALAEGKYTAEKLLGRRSRKHVVQYEVKWEGVEETTWVSPALPVRPEAVQLGS